MHLTKRRIAALLAAVAITLGMGASPAHASPTPSPTPALDVAHKPAGVKAPKGQPNLPSVDSLTPCPGGNCYKYSAGGQVLAPADYADGASIRASVSNPFLADQIQGDSHSVVELSIQATDPITGLRNIVEIGTLTDNTGVNGDRLAHLFVFSWVNNVAGSYNGGNGYADAVGCSPCAGDSIQGDVGTAKTFEWQHIGTAWWAKYNGNYVGAFPDSTWSSNFQKVEIVQAFGELAVANDESCSDMGSGGHAGAASSTSIDQYTLTNSTASPVLTQGAVTVPSIWAYTQPSSTWIRVGGEGYNSVGEAIGVKGSCAPAAEGTPDASSLQVWKEQCPDGAAVTGCNPAWSKPWAGQTINACHPVTAPDDKWRRVWGNYLSSGKSFYVYAASTCGATRTLVTNASKLVTAWDIHGWARAA